MARGSKNVQAKGKPAKKQSVAKRRAPRGAAPLPALLRASAIEDLRRAYLEACARSGRTTGTRDWEAAFAPVAALSTIHAEARSAVHGDMEAAERFAQMLRDVAQARPEFRGEADRLRERVRARGATKAARAQAPGSAPLVTFSGKAGLYAAVAALGAHDADLAKLGLDVLAGLGREAAGVERIGRDFDRGGVGGLTRGLGWDDQLRGLKGRPSRGPRIPDGGMPDPEPGMPEPGLPEPGDPRAPDEADFLREACEALLLDAAHEGLDLPVPGGASGGSRWLGPITRIELLGRCAGSRMIVHGSGFGDGSNPHITLRMNVNGACSDVAVAPADWSDTRIEATLPQGVSSGPVGVWFDDQLSNGLRASRAGKAYVRLREVAAASRCAGRPMEMPSWPTEIRVGAFEKPCPPDLGVNVVQVGRPTIRFSATGGERAPGGGRVVQPDDEISLAWNVANATSVELRRTSGNGPGFDGRDRIQVDAVGTRDLGALGHTNSLVTTYRLTATNACGPSVADIEIVGAKRPELAIARIEVTQGIQTPEQTVKLVRLKQTVIRVHLTHGLGEYAGGVLPSVGGRARVRRDGITSEWLEPINGSNDSPPVGVPGATIDLPQTPDPTVVDDTLNFRIPDALCDGEVAVEVEAFVEGFGAAGRFPGHSQRERASLSGLEFVGRRRPTIRHVPVTVTPDANGLINVVGSNPPSLGEAATALRRAFRHIPTTPAAILAAPGYVGSVSVETWVLTTPLGSLTIRFPGNVTSQSIPFDIQANAMLETIHLQRWWNGDDDGSIYALLVPATPIWGRAKGTPGHEFVASISNVTTIGHELLHCFAQKHLPTGCGGSAPATGPGDSDPDIDPANWPDGGAVVDIPFDITGNRTVTASGGVWDIMSYCGTRWTAPKRWRKTFDWFGGE